MSMNDRLKKIFASDKWLMVLGVILAVILAWAVRSQRAPQTPSPIKEEPTISVYFHQTGEIKKMPLETYIEGVVAAEMEPTWPIQALEAQAIVARTFTLKKMESGPIPGKNADASTDPKEFQAYDAQKVNDRVRQAVKNTRGQVITYAGKPINAWFHANSGGKTANAVEGLDYRQETAPYAAPVVDVQEEPALVWTYTFTTDEVAKAARAQGVQVDSVTSIRIGRKGPSGRAETLIINGREVKAPAFRVAIGDTKMKSTLLDQITLEDGRVYMRGRGFGHGVGMSQWGAWLMAQRGKTAKDIINYYFKGVTIQTMWK